MSVVGRACGTCHPAGGVKAALTLPHPCEALALVYRAPTLYDNPTLSTGRPKTTRPSLKIAETYLACAIHISFQNRVRTVCGGVDTTKLLIQEEVMQKETNASIRT